MKTALKKILETETRPQAIFGFVHRRLNEIPQCFGQRHELQKLTDEQLLDLVACVYFGQTVSGGIGQHDFEIGWEAGRRSSTRDVRLAYERFGNELAFRVIAPDHIAEYVNIVQPDVETSSFTWSRVSISGRAA
jgi:hypothetical protein